MSKKKEELRSHLHCIATKLSLRMANRECTCHCTWQCPLCAVLGNAYLQEPSSGGSKRWKQLPPTMVITLD